MDVQLSELIEKIKKDGIEAAQAETSKLKTEAQTEVKKIIDDAKREADLIVSRAKDDAKRSEQAGIAALEQASRNLILAFKSGIQELLNTLTAETIASAYSIDVIKQILPDLVKNWAQKNTDSLSVLLSEADLKKLDEAFISKLSSALRAGVEIKPIKKLDSGFRIAEKDGAAFYDFSGESVAAMLSSYLNSKLAEVLKKTA